MKSVIREIVTGSFLIILSLSACHKTEELRPQWAIALHGGAGNISNDGISDDEVEQYKSSLTDALEVGKNALQQGHSALDVVELVVSMLEDNPLFNAGKGAVFNHNGKNELDAAIMDGSNMMAGAVAGVSNIKNPIKAARKVMEESEHVLLIGHGATLFAAEHGVEMVDSSYFFTEKRWKVLQHILTQAGKNGTVGCVAMDKQGNLAAATSTGGMTNKKYGRVGDVPIIGAGTYANNQSCAVSATGHGEYFIRYTVAHDIAALVQYKGLSLSEAAYEVLNNKLNSEHGNGGIIAIDNKGNLVLEMNSTGMFRAWAVAGGDEGVGIFRD